MVIRIRNPVEKLFHFHEELEKLFSHIFREIPIPPEEGIVALPVDIFENQKHMIIEVEVSGLTSKELEVYIVNDMVIIEGIKREKKEHERSKYLCMERAFGKFRRAIEIPKTVNVNLSKAKLKNGILSIVLQKIEDRRKQKHKIEIEEEINRNGE